MLSSLVHLDRLRPPCDGHHRGKNRGMKTSDFASFLTARISQPQHHCHVRPDDSWLWGCPVHGRIFSCIVGHQPLDSCLPLPSCDNQ